MSAVKKSLLTLNFKTVGEKNYLPNLRKKCLYCGRNKILIAAATDLRYISFNPDHKHQTQIVEECLQV